MTTPATDSAPATAASPPDERPSGAARSLSAGLARRLPPWVSATIGVVSLAIAVTALAAAADGDELAGTWRAMVDAPFDVAVALAAFAAAFAVRAAVWSRL